ncbi:hypothetical protein AVEN_30129-1 [Araneus ventricosus]|uniref:Uncharacterized protein n=1 Tax=Araneus ventricosus TaxID=182803 RepID=A0A4Y2F074_ARAVE|nr:hypothetical protein AVEN_30129-1 [Araneus ventricosus]
MKQSEDECPNISRCIPFTVKHTNRQAFHVFNPTTVPGDSLGRDQSSPHQLWKKICWGLHETSRGRPSTAKRQSASKTGTPQAIPADLFYSHLDTQNPVAMSYDRINKLVTGM